MDSAVTFANFVANLRHWATTRLGDGADVERVEKFVERASAWASASVTVGERVASILGREDIEVRFAYTSGIAFTDGKDIYLGVNWFIENIAAPLLGSEYGDSSSVARSWILLKGLIFHEVSHIIWTPRNRHRPFKDVLKASEANFRPKLVYSFNLLEDARIENLFTARYAPAIPVFVNLVREALVSPNPTNPSLGLLLRGRHYLPAEIRDAAWEIFAERAVNVGGFTTAEVDELGRKIDRYTRLVFPTDADEALGIIEAVEYALTAIISSPPEIDTHDEMGDGKPERVGDARNDIERVDDTFGDADADADAGADADADAGDDAGADAGADVDADAGASADADADAGGDAGDTDADADAGAGEAGSGVGDGVEELLDKLADELDLDSIVDREFKAVARAASADDGLDTTGDRKVDPIANTPVHALRHRNWARVARKKLASALGSVFFDAEDGYESGHSTGRLNIGDYIGSRGHHLDVFDRWVANADEATSFEVVVLLDTSGSMAGSRIRNAAASAWAIERALADNDIPTTLISFNTRSALMKSSSESFSEAAVPEWSSEGGTNISGAIRWANEIFGRSDKTHKVLLTLTDGAFYVEADEMKKLNSVAASILIRLGEVYDHYADVDHGHAETVAFDTEDDLRKMPDVLGAKILETTRNVLVSA